MAKKLNVELGFSVNNSSAKKQIDDLLNQLQKIQTTPSKVFDDKDLKDASKAAQELQQHIKNAVNTDTGKLDLTKFATSLNNSNTKLEYFRKELSKAGADGKNTFSSLANAIAQADAPMVKLNGRLGEFMTTLKNSARWQLSSNILHGLEGALGSAIGYAKDLDESLNNIRIVTGKSTDDMASFAKEANEAAKALSTTTTNYTDASLIYYQQGLSDEEVKKRTDITVKMGNAARESAEEVSQYMTAIWENYADGSESLESYADKITALGAATASSSKEIANGLEKFVAVGDQIGLSYDYATAALTTILAKTRQSEDVVGTALKTIFARIQGFELGETADDGVTLNKYSSALKAVGVDVLDVNGEMKDMDTILNELASKWGTLGKAQQNALAQTVAGVRQYTQLVALMDHWDFFEDNLKTIENSEGALQEQQNIYAEGWEAARKRVKASWEGLYDDLIDEQSITKLDNALADVLDTLGGVIDGFGGLYGILTTIGGFVAQKLAKEVPSALNEITSYLSFKTGKAQKTAQDIQAQNAKEMQDQAMNQAGSDDLAATSEIQGLAKVSKMKSELTAVSGKLSEAEKVEYQQRIESTQSIYDMITAQAKSLQQSKQELQASKERIIKNASKTTVSDTEADGQKKSNIKYNADIKQEEKEVTELIDRYEELSTAYGRIQTVKTKFGKQSDIWKNEELSLDELREKASKVIDVLNMLNEEKKLKFTDEDGNSVELVTDEALANLKKFIDEGPKANQTAEEFKQQFQELADAFAVTSGTGVDVDFAEEIGKLREELDLHDVDTSALDEYINKVVELTNSQDGLEQVLGQQNDAEEENIKHTTKLSEAFVSMTGSLSTVVGAATSLSNAWQILNDDESTTVERITAVISALTSVGFAIQGVAEAVTVLKDLRAASAAASAANAAAMTAEAGSAGFLAGVLGSLKTAFTGLGLAGGIFTGIAVAIGVATTALSIHNDMIQKEIDTSKEAIETANQNIESYESQKQSLDDLAKSYKEAKEAYETDKNAETRKAFEEAAKAYGDAINEQNEALKGNSDNLENVTISLDIVTGKYENIERAAKKATDVILEQEKTEANKAKNNAENEFKAEMRKGTGYVIGDKYSVDWNSSTIDSGNEYLKNAFKNKKSDYINYMDNTGGEYNLDHITLSTGSDVQSMRKAYEDIQEVVKEAENQASKAGGDALENLQASSFYQELTDWLDKASEGYKNLTDSTEKYNSVAGQIKLSELNISDDDIKSTNDYMNAVDELSESLAKEQLTAEKKGTDEKSVKEEAKNQRDLAESVLSSSDAWSEYASNYEAFKEKTADIKDKDWLDTITKYYNDLPEEDKKLFLEFDLDLEKSEKNLDAQRNEFKALEENNTASNFGSTIISNVKSIKNGKRTEADYSGIDWGNEEQGIIDFNEFLEKSASEQALYLLNLNRELGNNLEENKEKSLNSLKESLAEYKDEYDKASKSGDTTTANKLDAQIQDTEEKIEELQNSQADYSNEVNEDFLDLLNDSEKFVTLMTTTQQLTGDLQTELANMIVDLDGATIDQKLEYLSTAFQASKIGVEDLKGALDSLISNGDVSLEKLKGFFADEDMLKDSKESLDMYRESLEKLAETYDNCEKELLDYKQALLTGNDEIIQAAQSQLEMSTRAGEDAEKYDIEADRIEMLAKSYLSEAEAMDAVKNGQADAAEIAEDMARAEIRLNDAIDDLYNNWDDYEKVMDVCNDTSEEGVALAKKEIATNKKLSDSYANLKEDIAGMLDTTSDLLGDDWIVSNMNDVKAAAEGDEEALKRLRENAVTEILVNSNLQDLGYDVDALSDKINNIPDGELSLDDTQFVQELVWAMQQAGLAQDEIESRLSGMGISVDLEPLVDQMGQAVSVSDVMGGTAGQAFADAYAASAGVDSEITSETKEDKDKKTITGYTSHLEPVTAHGTITVPMIDQQGQQYGTMVQDLPYEVYSQITNPTYTEAEDTKQTTTNALKVKSANKQSGGNISIANRPGGTNRQPREARTRTARTPRSSSGAARRSMPRAKSYRPTREVNVSDIVKDDKKKLKDEKERYHVINNQLEDISHNLNDIAQLKDRAFGKNKLNALKAENKELQAQAKAQAKLVKETEKYLKTDKAAVQALGATIGSDGTITNYDALMTNKVKSYNNSVLAYAKMQKAAEDEYNRAMQDATNRYNASSRSDADSAIYDAAAERAKERKDEADKQAERYKKQIDEDYQDFTDKINQYEETYDKMREEKLKEQQIQDQIYDNELETIQYEVEIKVDVDEDTLKFLNELFDQMGDSADYAADRIANLTKQAKAYNNEAKAYENGISSILKHAGADQELINGFINGKLTKDQIKEMGALGFTEGDAEALRDYSDKLIELNNNYRDLRDTMVDQVSAAFDEYIEKLEDASDKIEKLQKVTETYKNIIDVVGKRILDPTGKITKALDDAAFNSVKNLTKSNKSTLDFAENALKEAKKTRDSLAKQYGEDNETVRKWDEQVKELEDKRDEAYSDWLDAWEAECEAARTTFEDTLESIITNFETKISGLASSLDMLNDAYERQSKVDEVYVDDYEKIYQLSKLSREISKSIDDTSQVKNKEKLKKLQDEIVKKQEQGVKLSQYDLDYLEKKYQLELARQQLEEAKNAKTQVTMKRDSEGNYGYVYTADANAVADAEQNYEDRLHELQELNSEYIKTLQGDIIQVQQDLENDLKDFAENFKGTQEEYEKGVAEITEKYKTLMEYKQQQMQNVLSNNRDLYMNDWKSYSEATGYKLSVDADYLDKWEETNYSIITGYETLEDAMSAWRDGVEQVTNDANEAYRIWYEQTNQALEDGGTSMDNFANKAGEMASEVTSQTDKIAEGAKEMSETFKTSFDDILENAKTFSQQFEDVIMGIIDSNTKLADSIRKVLAEASKVSSSTNSGTNGSYTGGTSDNISGNGSSTSGGSNSGTDASGLDFTDGTKGNRKSRRSKGKGRTSKLDAKTKYGVALAIIEGTYGWGDDPFRSGKLTQKFGSNNGIQAIVNKLWAEGKVFSGAWEGAYYGLTSKDMPRYAYNRFNTGGYTGYWPGDTGKLAFLDSKEIVLNKDDTANFLSAVDIVRDIAKTIDLTASSASNSFSRLFAAAGIKTAANTLEQEVHITAEFPNATNKNEILDAFDNVINLATQYANRSK